MKVRSLCEKLAPWCGGIRLGTVGFTKIQEAIKQYCPQPYFTVIMRRQMMMIADDTAAKLGCGALITGESLGQVASQTMAALACTDAVSSIPVLRPLIGLDKEEIIRTAKRIDTFETSILPYDDCCTVFAPKRPKTRPLIADVLEAESGADFAALRAEVQIDWENIY
jgi:thiamine biosynthesis protein ThiI